MASSVLHIRQPMDIKLKLALVIFTSALVSLGLMFVVHTRHKPSPSKTDTDENRYLAERDNDKKVNVDHGDKFRDNQQVGIIEENAEGLDDKIHEVKEKVKQTDVKNNEKQDTFDKKEKEINGGVQEGEDEEGDVDDLENEDDEPAADEQIQGGLADDNKGDGVVNEMDIDDNGEKEDNAELQEDEGDEAPDVGEMPDEDGQVPDYHLYDDHPADKYLEHENAVVDQEPEDDGDIDNHLADTCLEHEREGEGEHDDGEDPDAIGDENMDEDDGEEDEPDHGDHNDDGDNEEANDLDPFARGINKDGSNDIHNENVLEKHVRNDLEDEFEDGFDEGLDNDDDNERLDKEDDGEHGDENAGEENDAENSDNDTVHDDKIIHDET